MTTVELVVPSQAYLPSYVAALQRGWSPDNIRGAAAAPEELTKIEQDPAQFLAHKADDRQAKGGPINLPDGSTVERLPNFTRWLWDGEFSGSIAFRWRPGTAELPPHVLGTSATPLCHGNRGNATPAGPWHCCCPKRAPRDFPPSN